MTDVISDYQKWKQQGENLRAQAKHAMETRFRELLSEAVAIAEEYRADFGAPLKPPSQVTSFKFKPSGKVKPKKASRESAPKAAPAPSAKKPQADPKAARLLKSLDVAKKKLDEAKTSGKPTRPLEDRIYELEDALRLSGQPA